MEISMEQAVGAATDLVRRINANPATPPQSHSIWINTETGEDGDFKRSISISVHPKWKGKIDIPEEHGGLPVVEVPWPKS